MRFKRILLIYPQYPESHYNQGRNTLLPIGLGIIGEMVELEGVDYEMVDLGLGYNLNYLNQRIKDYRPSALGISMMTFKYKHMYSLLEKIKENQTSLKIIVGGPHLTAWGKKVLEECPAVDFGVSSEGEKTIRELCQGKELSAIKGLYYRDRNNIFFTGQREVIENLDSIPFPKYNNFELTKYHRTIQINSSRGCPYECIFCQSASMLGKKWRSRSAGNITDELEYWYKKNYRHFIFIDDNFTLDKNRIYQLCTQIEERFKRELYLSAPGIRVDLVNRDLLKRMKEVGFEYIAFGVEAGNNKVLKALKKGFSITQAEMAVKDAVELGYIVKLYFMVGSPHETLLDIKDSINFALRYSIYDANFSSLMPIPETELIDWVRENGRLLTPPEVYLNDYAEFERIPHFDAPGMSLKERKYALCLTERVRGKIQRRFREKKLREKLARFGLLGIFGAKIYSFRFFSSLLNSKACRPLKNLLKKAFFKKNKMTQKSITVIHYRDTFLRLTENWIYSQVSNSDNVLTKFYTLRRENKDIFPFSNLRFFKKGTNCFVAFLDRFFYKFFHFYPKILVWFWQDRPNLIHAHFGISGYDMLPYSKWFNISLATSFYGYDAYLLPERESAWVKKYKKLFRQGQMFLAEGPEMKRRLVELGCPPEKIIIHHVGIKLTNYKFRNRKPDKEIRLMACGRFVEKRGFPYAIEALGRLKAKSRDKVHLTIIGDSDAKGTLTSEKRKILDSIKKYGLIDAVTLTGYISHDDLIKIAYSHHIFLAPSVHASNGDAEGGFPVILTEMLATGMPVVAFDHCDISQVVQNGKSGFLVPEKDVTALAEKINYLIEHPEIWPNFARWGRKVVEEKYNIDKLNRKLVAIYTDLVKRECSAGK